MTISTRRTFVQLSAGALLSAASSKLQGQARISISSRDGFITVKGANYTWEYSRADDTFHLRDSKDRLMVTGTVQPAVVVAPAGDPALRQFASGSAAKQRIEAGRVTLDYEKVNGNGRLSITWRFAEHGLWIDPMVYETSAAQDVVSVHYFTKVSGAIRTPSLHSTFLVVPGISETPSVSPIMSDLVHLNESVWLGRGSFVPGTFQQWGLPVHYFCGFSVDAPGKGARDEYTEGQSDAFVCGLADLPNGDLFLHLYQGKSCPWIDYRSDLWKHLRGPGRLSLGATLYWAIGSNYYDAIGQYYAGLLEAGVIQRKRNSPAKTAVALTPQFCTWGAQVVRGKQGDRMDEAFLTEIYRELKASGMEAGMFSIDEQWEERAGSLTHSTGRFPHFEEFLDRVRADGHRIGLWAALMRCQNPSEIGLSEDNMLKLPNGKPFMIGSDQNDPKYYILDFTQPEVAQILSDRARQFIRRYKPDLLKFDFGYEMPSVGAAAPQDKAWAGERLLWKGLDVIIKAMREENPDLVVMYYQLSPLFLDYIDLHSPDDLFLAAGEYDLEANRRFFFSSLLGPFGVPTYGSSGYDWASAGNIWFDSAAVGTLGSLNDFRADEQGEGSTPELVAKYNGLTHALRTSNIFSIAPLDVVYEAPTRGARARSWARMENGELVLLALRPPPSGGEDVLALRGNPKDLEDVLHCDVPVVVASQGSEGITQCDSLAVVVYGAAEIRIRRGRGRQASILAHYFGGAVTQTRSAIEDGWLKLTVSEHNLSGMPLEWIEIRISS